MSVGERIAILRKALGLTQVGLAQHMGITQQHVSHVEKGQREPSEQLLLHLCAMYNTTMVWLTTGEGDMFLPAEEIVRQQIIHLGERAYYEALKKLIDDNGLVVLRSALSGKGVENEYDPELKPMIGFLVDLWSVGDEALKGWAKVQFSRAFPDDVKEDVQKKLAKNQGRESIA